MKHKHRCITRTVETTPSRAVLGWFIHTCLGCGAVAITTERNL